MARSAVAFSSVLVLAFSVGCATDQPVSSLHGVPSKSRVLPSALISLPVRSMRNDLVYVSNAEGSLVMYDFPKIKQQIASISVSPRGLCSDKHGNVWATVQSPSDLTYELLEYAHGGNTPIAELSAGPNIPWGCAVDPRNGNLAVANFATYGHQNGTIAIFLRAQGTPKMYADSNIADFYSCAYDDEGNLFVQGYASSSPPRVVYAELTTRSRYLADVSLVNLGATAGGVQWDGQNFVVGLVGNSTIYRVSISQGKGSVVGQTQLDKGQSQGGLEQFWIYGNKVVATTGTEVGSWMAVYPYPEGAPRSHRHGLGFKPLGLTVSVGP